MVMPEVMAINVIAENWGEAPDDFWIVVQADIGITSFEGSEVFTFNVTSPRRLARILDEDDVQVGRGLLIMREFNMAIVKKIIKKLVQQSSGATWDEVAHNISRYAYWEMEGYNPDSP